jgi:hypothetical protein
MLCCCAANTVWLQTTVWNHGAAEQGLADSCDNALWNCLQRTTVVLSQRGSRLSIGVDVVATFKVSFMLNAAPLSGLVGFSGSALVIKR